MLEKELYYEHKNIKRENGFLLIQDLHILHYIVQIVCIIL